MNRMSVLPVLFLGLLAAALSVPAPAPAADTQPVHVENFPATQDIRGAVSIDGPVSHVRFAKKEAIVVPPSRRGEPAEMAHAGAIESDGFTGVIVSLQGEVKGGSVGTGAVGVLLIPDEEPVLRAFREARRLQFVLECASNMKSGDPVFFNSDQVQHRLTFPRYKMFLYNTTGKTVEANLYLTFTN